MASSPKEGKIKNKSFDKKAFNFKFEDQFIYQKTKRAHKAASHAKIGWQIFTDRIIELVSETNTDCVFLLWGNFAQKKEALIDKTKHKIIKCAHPSPLSCAKFFNSKCFSQANNYLRSKGREPVNWNLKKSF